MKSVTLVALAILFLTSLLAEGDVALYGISSSPDSPRSTIYRIDTETGEAAEIGLIPDGNCRASDFDATGRMVVACGHDLSNRFLILDPVSGSLRQFAGAPFGLIVEDLSFSPGENLLFAFLHLDAGLIDPPPPNTAFLFEVDLSTGQVRPDPEDAAVPLEGGRAAIAFFSAAELYHTNSIGDRINVSTFDTSTRGAVEISQGFIEGGLLSLDINPEDGRLYGTDGGSLYRLDPDTAEAEVVVNFDTVVDSVAWGPAGFSPPPPDTVVVPNLLGGDLNSTFCFSSSLTLLNSSSTTLAGAVSFFDDGGTEIPSHDLSFQPFSFGPNPMVLPDGLVPFFPPAELAAGWALFDLHSLKTRPTVEGEIAVFRSDETSCPADLSSLPSTAIKTVSRSMGVRPSLEFRTIVRLSGFQTSAIAIVNPSDDTATVTLTLLGFFLPSPISPVPPEPVDLTLSPKHQVRGFVLDFFPENLSNKVKFLPLPQTLLIRSDIPIAVSGIDVLMPEGRWLPLTTVADGSEP